VIALIKFEDLSLLSLILIHFYAKRLKCGFFFHMFLEDFVICGKAPCKIRKQFLFYIVSIFQHFRVVDINKSIKLSSKEIDIYRKILIPFDILQVSKDLVHISGVKCVLNIGGDHICRFVDKPDEYSI